MNNVVLIVMHILIYNNICIIIGNSFTVHLDYTNGINIGDYIIMRNKISLIPYRIQ